MDVRKPETAEIEPLAKLWHDAWVESHAHLVPAELRERRTLRSFRERLVAALSDARVVGPIGAPVGLCITKGDELYQLYVARDARGSGVAAALMTDAEGRLARGGVRTAWLSCAIGNDRAARFYEKNGWRRIRVETYNAETSLGTFPLDVWRYEKSLPR